MTTALPNLAKIATEDLVEKIGTGSFKASYINWSRTVNLLREHAPGWEPEIVLTANGEVLHRAPIGAFMMLRFRNGERVTEAIPQAVMDNRNAAIPFDKITARDITDTHRRGICLAAAMTFGLAYELWAKMPLEKGFTDGDEAKADPEPKRAKTPFPAGPAKGIHELKQMSRPLYRDLQACGDEDELQIVVANNKELLDQIEAGWPDGWDGIDGDGNKYPGFKELSEAAFSKKEAA